MHANVRNIWTVEGSGLDKEDELDHPRSEPQVEDRNRHHPPNPQPRPDLSTADGGRNPRWTWHAEPKATTHCETAYDRGWYDAKSGVTITDLSSELGMARATLSEHLNKISNIVMQTLLGTYDDARIDASQANRIAEELERVLVGLDEDEEEAFEAFLKEFRGGDPSTNP